MKLILIFTISISSFLAISAEQPPVEIPPVEITEYHKYQGSIAFKLSADLADNYWRCAALFSALYGYTSNNPSSLFSEMKPQDFVQSAKTFGLFAAEIQEKIGWVGESKLDEGMNRTLYYKDIVKAAEDDVSLLLFIREELKICMEIIKKNR